MAQQFEEFFTEYDSYRPVRLGFAAAIEHAVRTSRELQDAFFEASSKLAGDESELSSGAKALRALGSVSQLWKAPELGVPQKPSTLGQLLVLSSLGALGGYGAGRVLDYLIPGEDFTLGRIGAAAGAGVGAIPAVLGGTLNAYQGKPILSTSFWDWQDRPAKTAEAINVAQFNQAIWNDPGLAERLPPTFQAAASGLVTGASNLPGKRPNSPFVTPLDIARMAVGMGSGAASGYAVGTALSAAFGTSPKLRKTLINSGAMAGLVKTVIPIVFGGAL